MTIERKKTNYSPPTIQLEQSVYFNKFKVGASIFPRNLYFIEIISESKETAKIKTEPSIEKIAKEQWKNISLTGVVNKNYLYCTLLAWELLSFGFIRLREIALPIITDNNNKLIPIPISEMDEKSKDWFIKTEKYWNEKNTEKSKIRFPSLFDRLNYNNLLVKQEMKDYLVLYSGTGTNICSCVIERKKIERNSNIFIADVKTWIFETNNKQEAYYLSAILNSQYLNLLIKPLQPQGLGGGRAIHRRPLEFPIPEYNEENSLHLSLTNLSTQAHELIHSKVKTEELKTRKQGRELVKEILDSINELTKNLLEKKND